MLSVSLEIFGLNCSHNLISFTFSSFLALTVVSDRGFHFTIMPLAGSAIKQNVRRIDQLDKGSPRRWLLLAGATDPPIDIDISDRRARDIQDDRNGAFLRGVTRDFVNMQDAIGSKLENRVMDLKMTRSDAIGHIKRLFNFCQEKGFMPMLYYSGHGQVGMGNWCFKDGTIGIQEIEDLLPGECYYPTIVSDACYSGHWANFCTYRAIDCLAACPEFTTAIDIPGIF